MKRIFAQKSLFYFLNGISLLVAIFSICGGCMIDRTMFYLLFISLFFTLLSLLSLINRIYFSESDIEFRFIARKLSIKFDDIKEIYIHEDLINTRVIFNFERELDHHCISFYEYSRRCMETGITRSLCIGGITRKDLKKILQNYKGKIN